MGQKKTPKWTKPNKGLIDTEPKTSFKFILCWNGVRSPQLGFCKWFYIGFLAIDIGMGVKKIHSYHLLNFIVLHIEGKAVIWSGAKNF